MSECPTCGGIGVVCIDDICRGGGECIHGDGYCPTCGGGGVVDDAGVPEFDDYGDEDEIDLDEVLDCGSRSHPGCRKCEVPE